MLKLSVDSVTGFSLFPLRLATYLGLIGGALMLVAAIVLVIASRTPGTTIPGWTSTVVIVAGVGAVQLFCLGLLGEYVGRMYTQLQGRPAYFIASDSEDRITVGCGRQLLVGASRGEVHVNPAGAGDAQIAAQHRGRLARGDTHQPHVAAAPAHHHGLAVGRLDIADPVDRRPEHRHDVTRTRHREDDDRQLDRPPASPSGDFQDRAERDQAKARDRHQATLDRLGPLVGASAAVELTQLVWLHG
jgi:hypothetical protein